MRAYAEAFSISAKWGYDNQSWNRVDNHNATYKLTRQSIPDLPSSLVQGARDCACEALKAVKCETLPERKPLSAMRYNQRVITVNLIQGLATTGLSTNLSSFSVTRLKLLESMFCLWMPDTLPRSALTAGILIKGTAKVLLIAQAGISCLSRLPSQPAKCDTTSS